MSRVNLVDPAENRRPSLWRLRVAQVLLLAAALACLDRSVGVVGTVHVEAAQEWRRVAAIVREEWRAYRLSHFGWY